MINKYLKQKPLTLPDSLAPFAASPQLHLWSTGNGTGYAELLSYCTCDEDSGSLFAKCDSRSMICANNLATKGNCNDISHCQKRNLDYAIHLSSY